MRKIVLVLPVLALSLAACTPEQQNAAIGATAGALVGSAVSSESDRTKGAIVGAAVGVAGAAIVNNASANQQQCNYRDSYGRIYQAPC